jgi:DNA (cytosine-5)-methyltransferase 1
MPAKKLGFYEFFAGGGMARIGLGSRWECLFANDNSAKKAWAYKENFSSSNHFILEDIAKLTVDHLPGNPVLSWASFPCQDLSLAGDRGGLKAKRSGTFWAFWELMKDMSGDGRPVPFVVLENVVGAITSNGGKDFDSLIRVLMEEGYNVGPFVMDAVKFVPQSRPRLFIVALKNNITIPDKIINNKPQESLHSKSIRHSFSKLPQNFQDKWIWWNLPDPPQRQLTLADVIEDNPEDVAWHNSEETDYLLSLMSGPNINKVKEAMRSKKKIYGTIYRRTRTNRDGENVQRAEVRFDQISGCLRTPAGGSSRQILLEVKGKKVRSRLISARETARLMGAPDSYQLPARYNEAYHLMGDGVVAPVVSWLEKSLLHPLIRSAKRLSEIE